MDQYQFTLRTSSVFSRGNADYGVEKVSVYTSLQIYIALACQACRAFSSLDTGYLDLNKPDLHLSELLKLPDRFENLKSWGIENLPFESSARDVSMERCSANLSVDDIVISESEMHPRERGTA
ncbi:unnamed protein product [Caretta caretta]